MQAKREYSSQGLSFNSYSNKNLAEIADRVVEEFKAEYGTEEDLFGDVNGDLSFLETERMLNHDKADEKQEEEQSDADDDDDFEFSFVKESEISPVAADEIFHNGQIRPVYPLFNRSLLLDNEEFMNGSSNSDSNSKPKSIRLPLRKLFLEEERDPNNSSCSSSEADDLEGIPEGTYCVWRPKTEEKSAESCKKSNSTGSSKRWKFRDLLYRSNSDGKDNFVFLTPSFKRKDNKTEKTTTTTITTDNASKVTGKSKGVPVVEGPPAMHNYLKNGGGEKRKTYLPYRQDLVGFFASMNGMSKNVMPL